MAAKSGASHAGAAFLSILFGALFKKVLDLHASLITDLSTQLGSIVGIIPGISLSEDVAGFLAISTLLAFLWGVAYHYTRHGSPNNGPKNYVTDTQSTNQAQQMEGQIKKSAADLSRFGQPDANSYRSIEATRETEEHLRSRLERDLSDTKTRLDDVHDRLYDADRRDLLDFVTAVQDAITRIESKFSRTVTVGPKKSGDDSGDDWVGEERREALIDSHIELLETSDELLSLVRDVHHAPTGQLDSDVFQSCERLVSELDRKFERRQDALDNIGERS